MRSRASVFSAPSLPKPASKAMRSIKKNSAQMRFRKKKKATLLIMAIIAYLRVSSERQDAENQRFELLNYANSLGMRVDEWVSETVSTRKGLDQRKLGELLPRLQSGDVLLRLAGIEIDGATKALEMLPPAEAVNKIVPLFGGKKS